MVPKSILPSNKEPFRIQLLKELLTAVGGLAGVAVASGCIKEASHRGLSFTSGVQLSGLRAWGWGLRLMRVRRCVGDISVYVYVQCFICT